MNQTKEVINDKNKIISRSAGILLHITSLPSAFGIGDFGPEAKKFADFLKASKQKYWQILPLNPVQKGDLYSPYSSVSGMAGNTLLISPELLEKDGLLSEKDLKRFKQPVKRKADFEKARKIREELFRKAYQHFQQHAPASLVEKFNEYYQQESHWLEDYALFTVLKNKFNGKAWFQWPDKLKYRDKEALQGFSHENSDALERVKWEQLIFLKQWTDLKSYCNDRGVQLFGDLPFYVAYDSADVWSHPEIFRINKGKIEAVAGTPPDRFSADGQLWGMPVFNWEMLKQNNYKWWIERIRRNLELFDLLRLDHFRAFSAYWEVKAGSKTAKSGAWKQGPASELFEALKKEFGVLPFVAEDLGEIDKPVYDLRDEFALPGMKVLQFAFGDDVALSPYIPHNITPGSVIYTGTHDNNTTIGWYNASNKTVRNSLNEYTGVSVTRKNVHEVLARMAYASVADLAVLPLQDVLGLDDMARMNDPAGGGNNWTWRFKSNQLTNKKAEQLKHWSELYNRDDII